MMTEGRKEMPLLLSPEVCVVDVGLTNSQISGSDSMTNWTDSILTVLERCSIVLLYSGRAETWSWCLHTYLSRRLLIKRAFFHCSKYL